MSNNQLTPGSRVKVMCADELHRGRTGRIRELSPQVDQDGKPLFISVDLDAGNGLRAHGCFFEPSDLLPIE